jgi:hypothetical protein
MNATSGMEATPTTPTMREIATVKEAMKSVMRVMGQLQVTLKVLDLAVTTQHHVIKVSAVGGSVAHYAESTNTMFSNLVTAYGECVQAMGYMATYINKLHADMDTSIKRGSVLAIAAAMQEWDGNSYE